MNNGSRKEHHRKDNHQPGFFEQIAHRATCWTGSAWAFWLALSVVVTWAVTGPLFGYSDTWQLVINTGTTIVTFLMVFLIQRAQNKDSLVIQLKLNELVAAVKGASNRLIDLEELSEQDVKVLQRRFQKLAKLANHAADVTESHTIEEAKGHARAVKKEAEEIVKADPS